MSQADKFIDTVGAIRSASALTEATFVQVGRSLETSIEVLSKLTSSFEGVLADLEGENLGLALNSLSGMAARIRELGENQSGESARLEQISGLAETIGGRIAHMKGSLKDVDSLAVNSRIAVAHIRATTIDFTAFSGEIGRTLNVTRATLDQFAAELLLVRRTVAAAHAARRLFERRQHEAVRSITERLSATVTAIAAQNQRAARASQEVRLGGARIQQRIRDAVLASQIGDTTRQRLEHADEVLGMVAASVTGSPLLDEAERDRFSQAAHRLQSEQLADAARNFDDETGRIAESLNSLAAEARALRDLGKVAFGSAGRDGGTIIAELEGQIAEALVIFEDFETARAEVAGVTDTVSKATDSLCGHLRTVQSLEADIRIMGLNTTFKCARIGTEGLALGIIAQELRAYANGFAKAAGALMTEVESVAAMSGAMIVAAGTENVTVIADTTRAMRDSLDTLRRMGRDLDTAAADLDRGSDRVVALLAAAVARLETQGEIGGVLRDTAAVLAALAPVGSFSAADLPPGVARMLELIERGYTMASERAVHDRVLGRARRPEAVVAASAAAELDDFLF